MTALQDWISNRPMDPRTLKNLFRDVVGGQPDEEPVPPAQPPLLARGLERC